MKAHKAETDEYDPASDLENQLSRFEGENPHLAEAMRLLGMTMQTYQTALHALYGPRVSISSSTLRLDAATNAPTAPISAGGMWQISASSVG